MLRFVSGNYEGPFLPGWQAVEDAPHVSQLGMAGRGDAVTGRMWQLVHNSCCVAAGRCGRCVLPGWQAVERALLVSRWGALGRGLGHSWRLPIVLLTGARLLSPPL